MHAKQLFEKHIYEKQPCGHERRFIISADGGTGACLLCELEGVRAENKRLRKFILALERFAQAYAKGFMPAEAKDVAIAIQAKARKELEALDETD